MIYLSGAVNPNLPAGVGLMLTPAIGNKLPDGRIWAADTGCFNRPQDYTDAKYLDWLAARQDVADRCLFATAPDVYGNAAATLAVAAPMLPRIREAGFRPALVAQMGQAALPLPWGEFDALFFGGPNEWKHGPDAIALMIEAKRRGVWVHQGRVNSRRRFHWAQSYGADSADGTFVAFGPDVNIAKMRRWGLDTHQHRLADW